MVFTREKYKPEKKNAGQNRQKKRAAWLSAWEFALLEMRMPSERAAKRYGSARRGKQKDAAVNGNLEQEAHKSEDEAQLEKSRFQGRGAICRGAGRKDEPG